jgi:hypothetical protein
VVLRRADPLPTQLDDRAVVEGVVPDPPADTVASLEHDDVVSGGDQVTGGDQAGDAGSDHADVDSFSHRLRLRIAEPSCFPDHVVGHRDSVDDRQDLFRTLLAEFSDGERWKLIRAEGWDDFVERLSQSIAELPIRRRQALLMMLLAMSDGNLRPEAVDTYLAGRNMEEDAEVDALIDWLHQFRPHD